MGSSAAVPVSQVVLKVHSRCDLACDHCYVYEAVDQSWRGRPVVIQDDVASQAVRRIAEHVAAHDLPEVQVVLHGGEPLLAGRVRLGRIINELRQTLDPICELDLRIHTNGVQLNQGLCEFFAEHQVKVGISIDGDRLANDRHRRYADGRSSYDKVIRAIDLLCSDRFRKLYAGLLCTIDVANDPLVVYESLMALSPPRVDFLLPHATWNHPPVRSPGAAHEYADWLIAIYDRWIADGRPAEIRTFDSIISTLRGGESLTEALGLGPTGLVVIETDGRYEQVDSLKVAYEGAPETGMNVFGHTLSVVAQHPGIAARQQGMAGLCQTCRECPVVTSCGGGLYTHRYKDDGTGFANPSVYCADLLKLIKHVRQHQPDHGLAGSDRRPHAISAASFEALAAGAGDAGAVTALIQAQRSQVRAFLAAVYEGGKASPAVAEPVKSQLRAAWSVLAAVDRERPEALAALLGHPYVRAWALLCLEQMRGTVRSGTAAPADGGQEIAADLGHLGAVAAAAAARGGLSAATTVPIVGTSVHLPTLGRLVLGPAPAEIVADDTAAVSVISNAVIIKIGDSCWTLSLAELLDGRAMAVPAPGNTRLGDWQPVHVLRAPGWSLALDDIDPYRNCQPGSPAPRLGDAQVAAWQRDFLLAWQLIENDHTAYAPGLAAGLTTLTPLAVSPGEPPVSTVARQAFGAIGASYPADPAALAGLFIEAFQRAKLGAILDLCDLYDSTDDRLFQAPWSEDKVRLDGLLGETYTHLTGRGPAEWQVQTQAAIEVLLDSGALTPLGERFVRQMHHSTLR